MVIHREKKSHKRHAIQCLSPHTSHIEPDQRCSNQMDIVLPCRVSGIIFADASKAIIMCSKARQLCYHTEPRIQNERKKNCKSHYNRGVKGKNHHDDHRQHTH